MWSAIQANLFSPVVLCFFLGCFATLVRSDLRIPESVYSLLTTYLLFALGLKGGVELSHADLALVWKPALSTLAIGVVTPSISYFIARKIGKLSIADAAALAAHYGSISVVTFIAVEAFLSSLHIASESYLSTLVVLLEVTAIIFALSLAKVLDSRKVESQSFRSALHEILVGRSILLLLGALVIGLISGAKGYARVEPLFGPPFQGVVALFLLEMGLVASRRFKDLKKVGLFIVAFGILVPIINGTIGAMMGHWIGLSLGGCVVLATLAGSASYIAAPAAVRIALPEANPGIYLTAALTVSFPFNIVLGIPLFFQIATLLKEYYP